MTCTSSNSIFPASPARHRTNRATFPEKAGVWTPFAAFAIRTPAIGKASLVAGRASANDGAILLAAALQHADLAFIGGAFEKTSHSQRLDLMPTDR